MTDKELSHFPNWFLNDSSRRDREIAMEQSGIPLEIRTRRVLKELGYYAHREYYRQNDVTHELDFLAVKTMGGLELPGGMEFLFQLHLVGECKHSETDDLFLFKAENGLAGVGGNFPVRLYPEDRYHEEYDSFEASCEFPFYGERFVEVNANNYKWRKDGNYSDRVIYEACERLVAACRFYKGYHTEGHDSVGEEIFDRVKDDYESLARSMVNADPEKIVHRLVEEDPGHVFAAVGLLLLDFAVPVLVLDDNRGFIEATLADDGKVTFVQELDVAFYSHVPRTSESYSPGVAFPVAVCKQRSLSKLTRIVETGTEELIEKVKVSLRDRQSRIAEKLLMSEINRRNPK